jgi:hypothetical protein
MLGLGMSCGGKAIVDGVNGGGGEGGTDTTTSTTTSWTTNPTTTSGWCTSHEQCPGGVCVFSSGQCASSCTPNSCDPCGVGEFCEPCPTSSCPACNDCVAACVPLTSGRCDDNDPCQYGMVCSWWDGVCLQPCDPNGQCGDWYYCEYCATSSCCGCADCVAACLGGE